ncbi:hypothetical protein ACJX0J_031692, partial [Zea mays]
WEDHVSDGLRSAIPLCDELFDYLLILIPVLMLNQIPVRSSWDFMRVDPSHSAGILPESRFGEDSIIGVLDTVRRLRCPGGSRFAGIWPESASFRDDGMSEAPRRWKGQCIAGDRFNATNCNRLASRLEVLTLEAHDSLFFSLLPVGSVAIDSQISARKIALIHHVYPHLHFIFSAKFISFGLIPSNLGTVLLSRMPSQVMDLRRHLSQFSNPTVAASSFSEEQFRLPTERQRNEVNKDDFLRVIVNIVGDQMLKQAAHKVFVQ